jgi:hypothetical protein
MVEPPTGFRGNTGIGALSGISAVGPQDTFLYSKETSPTTYNHKSYTQTTQYYRYYKPVQSKFLGQEIRHVFIPQEMGDLVTGLMLKFTFPTTSVPTSCAQNLGLSMIKRIDLFINDEKIQSLKGDWMSIYETMHSSSQDRENILGTMYNFGTPYDQKSIVSSYPKELYYPIPFFFNNHYNDSSVDTKSFRPPLPVCALYNSKITIVINFLTLEELVQDTSGFSSDADLSNFIFVTEEVKLSNEERYSFLYKNMNYPIEKINDESVELEPKALEVAYRYYLNSYYTSRAIFWTFKLEQGLPYNPDFYSPVIKARINLLNKSDRSEFRDPLFFKQFQSYIHDFYNNGVFYSYSFSESPLNVIYGDYEYVTPRPQSAYIDMFYSAAPVGFRNFSEILGTSSSSYTYSYNNLVLDTSLDLTSLDTGVYSKLKTNSAYVGLPSISYTSTDNVFPWDVRFTPSGSFRVNSTSSLNINSAIEGFPVAPGSKMLLTVYYLSVVNLTIEDGRGYVV